MLKTKHHEKERIVAFKNTYMRCRPAPMDLCKNTNIEATACPHPQQCNMPAQGRSCLYFQHRPVVLCSKHLRFCQPGVPSPANSSSGSSKHVSTFPRAPPSIRHSPRPRPRIRIPQLFQNSAFVVAPLVPCPTIYSVDNTVNTPRICEASMGKGSRISRTTGIIASLGHNICLPRRPTSLPRSRVFALHRGPLQQQSTGLL
ncbi:hypothetical protein BDP81DRAFT_413890 [Colletotrichum phormii]|uniref:Uncharacterized protein n=1 Tax=Colletotrichum phormii TaxID=359342 RepID=A0AAJ0ELW1_9PEZI|nr:uncharacterized protein BDP81DRAFT_413890 [Colletotrichum phormii]KAK1655967.1 hypothetical protein BDP81DRAFT_413890 [Colletotrichum phormii]